jgi:hypothetical protein
MLHQLLEFPDVMDLAVALQQRTEANQIGECVL